MVRIILPYINIKIIHPITITKIELNLILMNQQIDQSNTQEALKHQEKQ